MVKEKESASNRYGVDEVTTLSYNTLCFVRKRIPGLFCFTTSPFSSCYDSSWSRTDDTLKDDENWFLVSSSSCSTRVRDCNTEICCLRDSMVSSRSW